MTEDEWLAANDPSPMLRLFLFRRIFSERKQRLLACGCCRCCWEYLVEAGHRAVITAERFVDGAANEAELATAGEQVANARESAEDEGAWWATHSDAYVAAFEACYASAGRKAGLDRRGRNEDDEGTFRSELAVAARLVRDVLGNPFRPIAFDAAWRSDTAVSISQGMYVSRDFSAMPILADSLQDAGCDNDDVLRHCRDEKQVHVRGCWVVDLVLGKS